MIELKNESISVQISELGAELLSLKVGEVELIGGGDERYWRRHAPILFPIVGSVFGGVQRVDGREYSLSQHGFARDSFFDYLGKGTFVLRSSEDTLQKFPFDFELSVVYTLSRNSLIVTWKVKNTSERRMYYQIGAHPAFNYLDFNENDAVHGYLNFYADSGDKVSPLLTSALKEGFALPVFPPVAAAPDSGTLTLGKHTFDDDALMFEGSQVAQTVLMNKEGIPYLCVCCPSAQVLGIWSPPGKDAPFVCIEPWMGRCDYDGFCGDISQREYIQSLEAGEETDFEYVISVL